MRGTQGALATAGAVVAALLLLWGAGADEAVLTAPSGSAPVDRSVIDAGEPRTDDLRSAEDESPVTPPGEGLDWWLVVQLVLIVALVWLALRWFRSRPREPDHDFAETDPGEELAALLQATSQAPTGVRGAEGEPRNDVVACWVALEEGVARAGLTPEPSETSADLARRVLHRWRVDEDAVSTLARLYREARFSRHAMTPAHRVQAQTAVTLIHQSLLRHAASWTPPEGVTSPREDGTT